MKYFIALAILIWSSNVFAKDDFTNAKTVLKNSLHAGFKGINNPGDQLPCELKIKYEAERILITLEGNHPDGEPAKLEMVLSANDPSLIEVIVRPKTFTMENAYWYVGYGVADRRELKVRNDSVSIKYITDQNPLGSVSELTCWPKK